MSQSRTDSSAVNYLRSAKAVRDRCQLIFVQAKQGSLKHFAYHPERLSQVAELVARVTKDSYPDLKIPFHSRWRHFGVGGINREALLENRVGAVAKEELARIKLELAIVSVLLDAGAGAAWSFNEAGKTYSRSEGLAVASIHLYLAGAFSADRTNPFRVDGSALQKLTEQALGSGFQVSASNPLLGLSGRVRLLNDLGKAVSNNQIAFGSPGRLGAIFDYVKTQSSGSEIQAADLLRIVLNLFSDIWPGRITLDGQNLGDVWRHPGIVTQDATTGLIPFHKLSQWLTLSLIEPLEQAGIKVLGLDALTGLPEYRNGGLFIDAGVLVPKDPELLRQHQTPDAEAIVEWRALTVALLDELADPVRRLLGKTADNFPLACILEGGTWKAGRIIAAEKRPGGIPPIQIQSDGTVF